MPGALDALINDILCGSDHFLGGVQKASSSQAQLVTAVVEWAGCLRRDLGEVVAGVEPCVRQSIVMSLIPARAVDPAYRGSIDKVITEHLQALGLELGDEERRVLRDLCLNVIKLRGMTAAQARSASLTIAELRTMPQLYYQLVGKQGGRCCWCGVELQDASIVETLEHVTPKHLGDDMPNGSNWALACLSCNRGKADVWAWGANASAHDYVGRVGFSDPWRLDLVHRWAVLMRTGRCDRCGNGPDVVELWVYKRIETGLPIPANCGASCVACAKTRGIKVVEPRWDPREALRGVP
jgi:ferredoxin